MALEVQVPDHVLDAFADRLEARVLAALDAREGSPWLDVAGAAEYLACKPRRLYDLTSQDRVPVHREGSRLLFDRRELDAWIRSGAADTALTPPADRPSSCGIEAGERIGTPPVTGGQRGA